MKYKHKPIPEEERIVDAIQDGKEYIIAVQDGTPRRMDVATFDSLYEPLKREPRAPKKPKKARANPNQQ